MSSRQLHLGAFMRPVSIHTGAWRYPGSFSDANFNLAHLVRFAQTLERGKFDAFFMADHLAVLNMPIEALKRSHTVTSFEPFTLLSALAMVTKRIGLVATASTTFDFGLPHCPPVRLARPHQWRPRRLEYCHDLQPGCSSQLRSRRAMEHAERYARAREFYDVVTGLWDSWADDAFARDAATGLYSIRAGFTFWTIRANTSLCAARSILRGRCRGGRSSYRRAPPRLDGS